MTNPRLRANRDLLYRSLLNGLTGVSFDGRRDVYEAAGFPRTLSAYDYLARYQRQGIAHRLVDVAADECWRKPPKVLDGINAADGRNDTPFALGWQRLAEQERNIDGETRRGLLHYLRRLDRASGIGRYGCLLFGLRDGLSLDMPVKPGSIKGSEGLLYVNVLDETNATIESYITNETDSRFGRPEYYQCQLRGGGGSVSSRRVHWSRLIHVVTEPLTDELFGSPRLEQVWNDLVSLEKILAATGEAGWQLMNPGHVITTQDGYRMSDPNDEPDSAGRQAATDALAAQEEQIDDFIHGFRRWLQLEGFNVQTLPGQLQDPSMSVEVLYDAIAGAVGIPKRMLKGAEAGQLASTQDEDTWSRVIDSRQLNVAQTQILFPVINRLIWYGVLPPPTSGSMYAQWESLRQMDEKEQAEIAKTVGEALKGVGAKVDVEKFVEVYLPKLPTSAVENAPPPPPPVSDPLGVRQPAETQNPEVLGREDKFSDLVWSFYP